MILRRVGVGPDLRNVLSTWVGGPAPRDLRGGVDDGSELSKKIMSVAEGVGDRLVGVV